MVNGVVIVCLLFITVVQSVPIEEVLQPLDQVNGTTAEEVVTTTAYTEEEPELDVDSELLKRLSVIGKELQTIGKLVTGKEVAFNIDDLLVESLLAEVEEAATPVDLLESVGSEPVGPDALAAPVPYRRGGNSGNSRSNGNGRNNARTIAPVSSSRSASRGHQRGHATARVDVNTRNARPMIPGTTAGLYRKPQTVRRPDPTSAPTTLATEEPATVSVRAVINRSRNGVNKISTPTPDEEESGEEEEVTSAALRPVVTRKPRPSPRPSSSPAIRNNLPKTTARPILTTPSSSSNVAAFEEEIQSLRLTADQVNQVCRKSNQAVAVRSLARASNTQNMVALNQFRQLTEAFDALSSQITAKKTTTARPPTAAINPAAGLSDRVVPVVSVADILATQASVLETTTAQESTGIMDPLVKAAIGVQGQFGDAIRNLIPGIGVSAN